MVLVAKPIARLNIVAKRNLDAAFRASPKVNMFNIRWVSMECRGDDDSDDEGRKGYICLVEGH